MPGKESRERTEDRLQGPGTRTGKEEAPDRERTEGDSPGPPACQEDICKSLGSDTWLPDSLLRGGAKMQCQAAAATASSG